MGSEEQLIHLYTGSQINSISIKEFLEENYIPSFIRNDHLSGNIAGFGAALPESGTSIFVKKRDFMKAKILLDKYIESTKEE